MSWPSSSRTCVPTGTRISTVPPVAPCFRAPRPGSPFSARNHLRARNDERSRRSGSATRTTSPPGPPSPPSGPPFGTCFSRRKWRLPSPPRPACTRIRARSWNMRERYNRCVDWPHVSGIRRRVRPTRRTLRAAAGSSAHRPCRRARRHARARRRLRSRCAHDRPRRPPRRRERQRRRPVGAVRRGLPLAPAGSRRRGGEGGEPAV